MSRLSDHLYLMQATLDRTERQRFACEVLAETLGCRPQDVVIGKTSRGQPFLLEPADRPLYLSLAHRGDLNLVGTADRAIGVDVEWADEAYLDVARDQFSEGEWRWLQSVEQRDAFSRLWTAKEAVLKATGQGIARGMAEPDFSPFLRAGEPFTASECEVSVAGGTFSLKWWTIRGERSALATSAILRRPLP